MNITVWVDQRERYRAGLKPYTYKGNDKRVYKNEERG
jgi:hypothetical protein